MSKYSVVITPSTLRRYRHFGVCIAFLVALLCLSEHLSSHLGVWHTVAIIGVIGIMCLPLGGNNERCYQQVVYELNGQITITSSSSTTQGALAQGSLSSPLALYLLLTQVGTRQAVKVWVIKGEIPEADFRRLSRIIIGLRRSAPVTR